MQWRFIKEVPFLSLVRLPEPEGLPSLGQSTAAQPIIDRALVKRKWLGIVSVRANNLLGLRVFLRQGAAQMDVDFEESGLRDPP